MDVRQSVLDRYSEGAQQRVEALCCPVDYDARLLEAIPAEILERDYGCGDPSRYVREGDTVLDLGSGGGKICYMAAQLVGPEGLVIGVDMNDDMLDLARRHQGDMGKKLGGNRVDFRKGYIQDLALDVAAMEAFLAGQPVTDAAGYTRLHDWQAAQRREQPLIADASVDLVISNCVLNLVPDADKNQLVREVFRVLRPGGRVAISDIVSDEPIPEHLKNDPALWSGCISGVFQEEAFLQAFREAGFVAVAYDKWDAAPWQVIEGIEFRSVTLTATKPEATACLDYGHAVMYRGPFSQVHDDEGHVYPRGARIAVCERSYRLLTEGPYADQFIGFAPRNPGEPRTFCAPAGTRRPAAETKSPLAPTCDSEGSCCC